MLQSGEAMSAAAHSFTHLKYMLVCCDDATPHPAPNARFKRAAAQLSR